MKPNINKAKFRKALSLKNGVLSIVLSFAAASILQAEGENIEPSTLNADKIIAKVNARPEGEHVIRNFSIELRDKNGRTRREETIAHRRYFTNDKGEQEKRTIIFYTEPSRVRGTGFLTYDYASPNRDDDQWLYLPALRKVRRISASDRGDYFLGTDFTYEEIKKEQKIEASDYHFELLGEKEIDGRQLLVVEGLPAKPQIAEELGISKAIWHIDPSIWMSRLSEFYDQNGNHSRTMQLEAVEEIDGYLSSKQIIISNHKTGHSSRIRFSNIDYASPVPQKLFTQARLRRGL
ncbi:outer membrane lipoprotein-sorting protein [uncultured Pseudoteredinibacter sp.]|uniref:outer membrane lipoprotein-sorting protein n=1 Tax=uncultured Pseudoteredinibacter sp. TaxID=1641701 RepID=UPI00261D592F|nr:outer membrane lipoprotein-sorting protein [uncultured Pseudoteredinibacter sp.]